MTERKRPGRARILPVMTLRRRLVIVMVALVAVAIALVGGISFSATSATFNSEIDASLITAARTVAAGGTVAVSPDRHTEDHEAAEATDSDDLGIAVVQKIGADGAVSTVAGLRAPLSVDSAQRRLARTEDAGSGAFDTRIVEHSSLRIYTLALGDGRGAIVVGRDMTRATHVVGQVALNTMLIGIGVMILAALIGWWISWQITRRLAALSAAAEHVARTGDLATPISTGGTDEVATLAGSLQTMLDELSQSRDAQKRLVEDAGHELRTPLTSLRTNTQVLRRYGELADAERAHLLDDIDGELKELTALVNELIELGTDSRPSEPKQPTALAEVVNSVAARIRHRTGRRIDVTADGSTAMIQRRAVARAVGNMVENAVKFAPPSADPLEVTVADGQICVSDRGPGVPAEDIGRIFDRFHRSADARSLPGSGLGLAIVRDVAARHGGEATAGNRPGGGLSVTLTLRGTG